MTATNTDKATAKHIGIVIEMGVPFAHHHACYKGIVDYVQKHQPDWQTSVDPFLTGLLDEKGQVRYDGIVGRITQPVADLAAKHGIPIVNHWLNSPAHALPSVYSDFRASGRIVAEHFLDHGYSKLGLISCEEDRTRPMFYAGMQEAVDARGAEVFALNVPYTFEANPDDFVMFSNQLRELLSKQSTPTGLFIPMDSMALYAMQACHQMGLSVPNDIGVAVFYNALDLCLNTNPTMTSIQANDELIGYEAMRLLDEQMAGKPLPSDQPKLIGPKTLRVRGSSEVFVSEDPVVYKALRYIGENARDGITVEDVANVAEVSVRTLSRRFNKYVGRSVLGEINRVRVQAIKQVLVDTEIALHEVATVCGFSSTSHFNVFFRKATNQTPGAYRKKHRGQS
jgi:LacI family transcriptional regulator